MATAVKMPALGESVTEGTVTTWLKKVGDTVAADEPIVEVSTDKVDSEVPSPAAGTLLEILVDEDETVEVGTEIARIGDASEAGGSSAPESSSEESSPEAASTAPEAAPVADVVPDEPTEPSSSPEPAAQQGGSTAEATDVKMPALGESVTEGTVTTWLKKVGDTVAADEPIVEVSTDKVDSEVPSPVAGTLLEILVDEDETVEVGTVIARVGDSSAAPAPTTQDAPAPAQEEPAPTPHEPEPHAAAHHAPPAPPAPPTHAQGHVAPPAPPVPHGAVPTPGFPTRESLAPVATAAGRKVEAADVAAVAGGYVTPIVRKFARELGVDLAGVTGTGIGGRIRREDVQAAADAAKASGPSDTSAAPARPAAPALEVSPLRGTTEKMTRLRQTVARRMVESLQTAAQLTTVVEVDVTRIAALRARSKNAFLEKKGTKLTFLPFFVKAATESLLYHPKLNATIDGKEVTFFDHEHVGIAVDTERGLMVPVIKDAGDKSLADIAHSINDLAARTRDGKISPDELSGSTFTITNTGSGGALFDTPILNMPETAILGVGTIVKRPVVVKDADGNETIGIRSMVYLALSYDHRLVDGADAARYLQTLKKRLEEGAFEADLEL